MNESTIDQSKQFVPNKKTQVHISTALGYFKQIWGWQDEEQKQGAINFLTKVLGNIRKNPTDPKFCDLNITKIRKLTRKWKSIPLLILFNAGFQEDIMGGGKRMRLNAQRDWQQFCEVADLFQNCKNFDPTAEPKKPEPVAPPPQKAEPMEVETTADTQAEPMVVEQNQAEDGAAAPAADKPAEKEEVVWEDDDDDVNDLLAKLKAEKAAKGLDTLNMQELKGLSKEEKLKLLADKREKFRKQKAKNDILEKQERAKKERAAVKAQADLKRRREADQNKMLIQMKKKEKADIKRRKERAREKIRKQKEQRRLERESREAAKKKAAQEQQ